MLTIIFWTIEGVIGLNFKKVGDSPEGIPRAAMDFEMLLLMDTILIKKY